MELQNTTGYEIVQKQGQRIYGGPPPGWTGSSPGTGTEIYCYRIPRDCFEDELVPVFASVGRIYELRLMLEFSGTNRTYCYVRYCSEEDAKEAVRKLNNFRIRPRSVLAVTRSVDNRRLSARLVPAVHDRNNEELGVELGVLGVEGLRNVAIQDGEWITLEFDTHRLAALARRQLVPGTCTVWGVTAVKQVEWARPDTVDTVDTVGRVLCVRNLPSSLSYSSIVDIFNSLSGGQVETVVQAGNHVLVTFINNEARELVRSRTRDLELEGKKIEVEPWHGYTLRRLDHGHQGHEPVTRTPHEHQPLTRTPSVLSSNTAKYDLTNLCLSQGWGLPSFHLTGHKFDPVTLSELFQVRSLDIFIPYGEVF